MTKLLRWSLAAVATVMNAIINSAFARTDSDMWAVGTAFGNAGSSPAPPMAYHWNGTAWTAVSTDQPNSANTFGNQISSISASSPSDIWAVGNYTTPDYTTAPYALHYDGSGWKVVPMVQPASSNPSLGSVTALSPTNAWAVGQTRQRSPGGTLGWESLDRHAHGHRFAVPESSRRGRSLDG
jgi:hypothetical protein